MTYIIWHFALSCLSSDIVLRNTHVPRTRYKMSAIALVTCAAGTRLPFSISGHVSDWHLKTHTQGEVLAGSVSNNFQIKYTPFINTTILRVVLHKCDIVSLPKEKYISFTFYQKKKEIYVITSNPPNTPDTSKHDFWSAYAATTTILSTIHILP